MLTDPQSVTISGTAHSLPRVSSDGSGSRYQNADGTVTVSVSHAKGRGNRNRRVIRIDHKKVAPDPLFPAQNTPYEFSSFMVFDVPGTGYTIAEQKAIVDGFVAALSASSGALITKILGAEN
jgi:hypothetical protein